MLALPFLMKINTINIHWNLQQGWGLSDSISHIF